MNPRKNLIPVLLGPTCSGKTQVGIELARLIKGEIISVDSRQVYKGLSIGTAAPSGTWAKNALVVQGIPHHLIGHLRPDQPYNAGQFARDAENLIDEILTRGHRPILVGGTGFYFKALQHGLPKLPAPDKELRLKLTRKAETEGLDVIYSELKKVDSSAAKALSPNDFQKVIRALEVYRLTGTPFSEWKEKERNPSKHEFLVMGLQISKELLEVRIETRSRLMEKEGMIEETETVLKEGYSKNCEALSSFGYREAVQVLEGALPRSEFLPRLIKGTKAYAKRQRTWFRTQLRPFWFPLDNSMIPKDISLKMKAFIESSEN